MSFWTPVLPLKSRHGRKLGPEVRLQALYSQLVRMRCARCAPQALTTSSRCFKQTFSQLQIFCHSLSSTLLSAAP